ncbi:GlxA family transcriptional regulator [Pelagovum sp. HNIBRBA483]|uniref:GlxA family transcriptional regulator n=1 Tax=Pelagovum sp. HNIBRBA483 TaxID=3233341 RepID=UPI0034A15201
MSNTAKSLFPDEVGAGQRPMTVGVLVMDRTNLLSLAAAVDPMRAANRRAGRDLFQWQFATPTPATANLTAGIPISGTAVASLPVPDLLLIVSSFAIEAQTTPNLCATLRRLARGGAIIAGVDGGSQIMARAGLLDGLRATTHWEDLESFAAQFPRITVVRDRFILSGRTLTTGGASPCLDMMLHLISSLHGRELAARVASAFIYDPVYAGHEPQRLAQSSALTKRAPLVAKAIQIMEEQLENPLPIGDLALRLGISRRRLEQQFQETLGTTPHAFGLTLRLAEARRLATDTNRAVQDIALATGFSSHAAFARAFQREFSLSVREIRRARGPLT